MHAGRRPTRQRRGFRLGLGLARRAQAHKAAAGLGHREVKGCTPSEVTVRVWKMSKKVKVP